MIQLRDLIQLMPFILVTYSDTISEAMHRFPMILVPMHLDTMEEQMGI
jgi:hypothetical protein